MSLRETGQKYRRFARTVAALATAGLCAGCFQPMYGERSPFNGPGVSSKLAAINIIPIDTPNGTPIARIGVEVRNQLIFALTGGSGGLPPTYDLKISLSGNRQQVIVDVQTARPDVENYSIDASYTLTELATKRPVVQGRTFARVSYDIPGQQQRFAGARGLLDAENRAAAIIADHIKQRLASYFVAGT
ncbi:MAG: hypothetical protein K8H87_15710 [Pseudorhodoplanes sp.]|nr:hypothetical protein [Pseudorhodoplanes sp.]